MRCVCERGPLYIILLHRDGAQACMCSGTHGDPSPPHRQSLISKPNYAQFEAPPCSFPLRFAYTALNINFKGVHMMLKIVALAISVE